MSSSALLFPESPNPRHQPGPRPPADRGQRPTPIGPTPLETGDLLSITQTAELLNVTYHTVYRLVKAGHLGQPVVMGLSGKRGMQVRRREVERFVERGGVGGGQ
jgi:excisionase family DNA binding protein